MGIYDKYRAKGYSDDEIFRVLSEDDPSLAALHAKGYSSAEIVRAHEEENAPPPPPPESGWESFKRGGSEAFQQVPQLGYGLVAGAGAVGEKVFGEGGLSTGVKKYGIENYQRTSEEIAAQSRPTDSWEHAKEEAGKGNFGPMATWTAHGLGYVGGQGLQMVATAGVGGIAGKAAFKGIEVNLLAPMVEREAARIAAADIAKNGIPTLAEDAVAAAARSNVASRIGQNVAIAGSAVGMEGGEIYGDLLADAAIKRKEVSGDDLLRAGKAALGAGGVEYTEQMLGLKALRGKLPVGNWLREKGGLGGRAMRGVAGAGIAAPVEYTQEYGQTLLEEYGKGNDAFSEPSYKLAREAGAIGALGGTTHGVLGGAFTGARDSAEVVEQRQEGMRQQAEAQQVAAQQQAEAQQQAAQLAEQRAAARTYVEPQLPWTEFRAQFDAEDGARLKRETAEYKAAVEEAIADFPAAQAAARAAGSELTLKQHEANVMAHLPKPEKKGDAGTEWSKRIDQLVDEHLTPAPQGMSKDMFGTEARAPLVEEHSQVNNIPGVAAPGASLATPQTELFSPNQPAAPVAPKPIEATLETPAEAGARVNAPVPLGGLGFAGLTKPSQNTIKTLVEEKNFPEAIEAMRQHLVDSKTKEGRDKLNKAQKRNVEKLIEVLIRADESNKIIVEQAAYEAGNEKVAAERDKQAEKQRNAQYDAEEKSKKNAELRARQDEGLAALGALRGTSHEVDAAFAKLTADKKAAEEADLWEKQDQEDALQRSMMLPETQALIFGGVEPARDMSVPESTPSVPKVSSKQSNLVTPKGNISKGATHAVQVGSTEEKVSRTPGGKENIAQDREGVGQPEQGIKPAPESKAKEKVVPAKKETDSARLKRQNAEKKAKAAEEAAEKKAQAEKEAAQAAKANSKTADEKEKTAQVMEDAKYERDRIAKQKKTATPVNETGEPTGEPEGVDARTNEISIDEIDTSTGDEDTQYSEGAESKNSMEEQRAVHEQIKGLDAVGIASWLVDNAANSADKYIAEKVRMMLRRMFAAGVKFDIKIHDGSARARSMYGVRGQVTARTGSRGEAATVKIDFNGPEVMENQAGYPSGMNYTTVHHELVHAATVAVLEKLPGRRKGFDDLHQLVVKEFNSRARAGTLSEFEKKIHSGSNNALADADELLAWGLTDRNMQEFLHSIKVGPITAWGKLVSLVRSALGIRAEYESALDRLMTTSDSLLSEDFSTLQAEMEHAGYSLGGEDASKIMGGAGVTDDQSLHPGWSKQPRSGNTTVYSGEDVGLVKAKSRTGKDIFLGITKDGTISMIDISSYVGKGFSAAEMSELEKAKNDYLSSKGTPVASGPAPTKSNAPMVTGINSITLPQRSMTVAPNSPSAGVWEKAGAAFDSFFRDPMAALGSHNLGWLSLDHLVEVARGTNDKLAEYRAVSRAMQSMSKEWVVKAAKIDAEWGKLDGKPGGMADQLHDVMRLSTRAKFDPTLNVAPVNAEETKVAGMFIKLSPDAVKVFKAARDHYAAVRVERQDIASSILTSAHRLIIASAKKSGDAKRIAKAEGDLARQLGNLDKKYKETKGPYFPLMRIGKWYATGMSKTLADLERIEDPSAAEEKKISELRKDEAHYTVSAYSSKSKAEAAVKELSAKYAVTKFNMAEEKSYAPRVLAAAGMQEVEKYLDSFDKGVADEIRTMMAEIYYESLPEHHTLKHEMKREGVHGEEKDMRRVFARSALSSAHYLSRLKYTDQLKSAMFAISEEGDKGPDARKYYNEIVMRSRQDMEETNAPWADKLAAVSYLAHLGANPAFILTNATQVAMITTPWLAARTSTAKATAALMKAYGTSANLIVSSYNEQGWRAELNWEGKVPAGVASMLDTLLKRNLLDITIEHDLGAIAEFKSHALGDKLKMANLPVHITELANRSVTAIAAYNLAINELKMNQAEAEEFASTAVSATQLDYSALNAPRHMRRVLGSAPAAKVIMQFRKYQQGMLWLIGRSIYVALIGKGATPKERWEAGKTLFGLFTTTGIMAGTLGMPMAGSALWIASALASFGGPDDEPEDYRVKYQNWLAELVGVKTATAITKGLPAALWGMDLEKRLGQGDIASPLPFMRHGKSTEEKTGYGLLAAAGAPVGTLVDMVNGAQLMGQGEWHKGMEKFVPAKGIQNLIRAHRFGLDGMTDKRGNTILPPDEFDMADIGLKAAGFATTKESQYYEGTQAIQEAKAAATEVRSRLLDKFAQARLAGEDTGDIMDAINDFNDRHPEKGVRIDASSRLKSVQAHKMAARQRSESGISMSKQNKAFAPLANFAQEE